MRGREGATVERYSPTHEWIEADGSGRATVGLTRAGIGWLGPVVSVRLAPPGTRVRLARPVGTLSAAGADLTVYAPASGVIGAHNPRLLDEPGLVTEDPERRGWLFRLALSDPSELLLLLDERAYLRLLSQQARD